MTLFVDTSAFYAAADRGHRSHAQAVAALAAGGKLATTDHVLVETWALIGRRLGRDAAERWWGAVRAGAAAVEFVGPADLEAAWAIGEAFADQDFSLVDRTSFAVMQRLGLHRVATLDPDFAVFRFGERRTKAFEIVR